MKSIVDYTNKLKDFFASKQALTNVEDNIAHIRQIKANGCTLTNGITKGTCFYLDGVLVKALIDISNGAPFTENTNYSVINDISNAFIVKRITSTITTLAGNATTSIDIPFSRPSGYDYAAITVRSDHNAVVSILKRITSSTAIVYVENSSSTTASDITVIVDIILYKQ